MVTSYGNELFEIIKNGNMSEDDVHKILIMKKNIIECKKMHKGKIMKGVNGRYLTYVKLEGGKRKQISSNCEETLWNKLFEFYKVDSYSASFEKIFFEESQSRLAKGLIQKNTYDRYLVDYKRFFENTDFAKSPIELITKRHVQDFVVECISSNHLTAKAFSGARTILNITFSKASRDDLTQLSITNVLGDMNLPRKIYKSNRKNKEEEVFTDLEVMKINNYILENPTIENLGIMVAFMSGLRVGELVALKPEDITDEGICVRRILTKEQDPTTNKTIHFIAERTKTENSYRKVIIPEYCYEVIREIRALNPNGQYLFEKNGKIIHRESMTKRLRKICRDIGIKERSMHKVRKTYASLMYNKEFNINGLADQLGHADTLVTQKYYIFNNQETNVMKEKIDEIMGVYFQINSINNSTIQSKEFSQQG